MAPRVWARLDPTRLRLALWLRRLRPLRTNMTPTTPIVGMVMNVVLCLVLRLQRLNLTALLPVTVLPAIMRSLFLHVPPWPIQRQRRRLRPPRLLLVTCRSPNVLRRSSYGCQHLLSYRRLARAGLLSLTPVRPFTCFRISQLSFCTNWSQISGSAWETTLFFRCLVAAQRSFH